MISIFILGSFSLSDGRLGVAGFYIALLEYPNKSLFLHCISNESVIKDDEIQSYLFCLFLECHVATFGSFHMGNIKAYYSGAITSPGNIYIE